VAGDKWEKIYYKNFKGVCKNKKECDKGVGEKNEGCGV
jgi:hypothetical protein